MLEALFDDDERTISSSLINLCYYNPECYKDKFKSAAGDSGLNFSSQISAIETTNMSIDVGVNLSQSLILFKILRRKIGTKFV